MVIGIVIDKLYPGKIGGAEQYIRNVIDIFEKRENVNMVLFLNEYAMDSFKQLEAGNTHRVCVPNNLYNVEKYFEYYIARYDIDLLFCPLFYIPYENCSIPMVTTIHDIQYEYFPQYFEKELLEYRRKETRSAVENSAAIITISEFSKKTIIEKFGMDEQKIFVIYENSDKSFEATIKKEKNMQVREKLPEKYFFYPANGWPHKNHKKLIDAYKILKEKYHTQCKLVLTGNAYNDANGLQRYINENELENDVISLGYIEQEDMPYVFYNAEMLVFPSLFEGFGIPLVEAMRMGTPIACSNCGSIPEIAGDAAVIFDANDEYDIAEKVHLLNSNIDFSKQLVEKGRQRAKYFSWNECAVKTLEVFDKQIEKQPESNRKEYQFPQVIFLVPVYSSLEGLGELLESIQKQEYANKRVVIFTEKVSMRSKLLNCIKSYSMNIEVIPQKRLSNVLEQMMQEDENGIIGIFQVGQVLEDTQILDNIVAEFIQSQRDICWVKPKREGFWGLQLYNNNKSSIYQQFIEFDQASCSIVFVAKDKRTILKEIPYWFYGHYQEVMLGHIARKGIEQNQIINREIIDNSSLVNNYGKNYIRSIHYLWEINRYIPLSIIDTKNTIQLWMVRRRIYSNKLHKKYYKQIENRGVEYDGIALDGWMSKRCEFEVEVLDKNNILHIEGINNVLQKDAVLDISVDNKEISCHNMIDFGGFVMQICIPEKISRGKHLLSLEVQKTFSYYNQTKSDIRALSIRFTKILFNEDIIWEQEE